MCEASRGVHTSLIDRNTYTMVHLYMNTAPRSHISGGMHSITQYASGSLSDSNPEIQCIPADQLQKKYRHFLVHIRAFNQHPAKARLIPSLLLVHPITRGPQGCRPSLSTWKVQTWKRTVPASDGVLSALPQDNSHRGKLLPVVSRCWPSKTALTSTNLPTMY